MWWLLPLISIEIHPVLSMSIFAAKKPHNWFTRRKIQSHRIWWHHGQYMLAIWIKCCICGDTPAVSPKSIRHRRCWKTMQWVHFCVAICIRNIKRPIYYTHNVHPQDYQSLQNERGLLLRSRHLQYMLAFSYWPQIASRDPSHIYEMRSYRLKPGTMIEWGNNWARAINFRQTNNEAFAGFFSQIGRLYNVHHIWCKYSPRWSPVFDDFGNQHLNGYHFFFQVTNHYRIVKNAVRPHGVRPGGMNALPTQCHWSARCTVAYWSRPNFRRRSNESNNWIYRQSNLSTSPSRPPFIPKHTATFSKRITILGHGNRIRLR